VAWLNINRSTRLGGRLNSWLQSRCGAGKFLSGGHILCGGIGHVASPDGAPPLN
jgi:hypothetical protein